MYRVVMFTIDEPLVDVFFAHHFHVRQQLVLASSMSLLVPEITPITVGSLLEDVIPLCQSFTAVAACDSSFRGAYFGSNDAWYFMNRLRDKWHLDLASTIYFPQQFQLQ
ncbi:hypothetical protein TYRP_000283 [Tyrophagus putrescentiae]|nr:hypothetical protein TYRP_000283 [Tyrophagus putrescentiae]